MNQTIVESAAVRPATVLHGGVADQPTIRERAVISASTGTTGLIAGQDAIIKRATGCASATAADVPAQRAIVEQTAECPPPPASPVAWFPSKVQLYNTTPDAPPPPYEPVFPTITQLVRKAVCEE